MKQKLSLIIAVLTYHEPDPGACAPAATQAPTEEAVVEKTEEVAVEKTEEMAVEKTEEVVSSRDRGSRCRTSRDRRSRSCGRRRLVFWDEDCILPRRRSGWSI